MNESKPRYCMVVHAHYPIREPRVEREAEELANRGYDVDVLCLRHPFEPSFETIGNIHIYRLPVKRHKKSGVFIQFFEYLFFFILTFFRLSFSSVRYDVVHIHNLPDFLVFSALIPRWRGAKLILDIHDLMPEFYLSRFKDNVLSRFLSRLLKLQEKLSCNFVHHVITVSEPWRQTLIQRGIPSDKISVIMNVAGERFTKGIAELKPPLTEEYFHMLYHGTIARRYGIGIALKAVSKIRHKIPNLRFTIHGQGKSLDILQNLAADLNLNDIVTFSTEFVPTEELPKLITSAHVGVVPYRKDVFTDGILPTKLMEYVALGVPAIVARTSTIEAYFDDSMVKFFTPENEDELAQAICHLYENRGELSTLSEKANVFNKRYNWTTQAENLLTLVTQLCQQSPSRKSLTEQNS